MTEHDTEAFGAWLDAWLGSDGRVPVTAGHDRSLPLDGRLQAAAPASVEIVSGEEAQELPAFSLVVSCRVNGAPWGAAMPMKRLDLGWKRGDGGVIERLERNGWYRVLYRAPEPAPAVEDTQPMRACFGVCDHVDCLP